MRRKPKSGGILIETTPVADDSEQRPVYPLSLAACAEEVVVFTDRLLIVTSKFDWSTRDQIARATSAAFRKACKEAAK